MNDQSWRHELAINPGRVPCPVAPDRTLVAVAAALYKGRRRRMSAHPDAKLWFQEPAWDILLDLYVAAGQGRQVNVGSACIAACVPNTTALRWLRRLEAAGMIASDGDAADRRLRRISLSDIGVRWMNDYLATLG